MKVSELKQTNASVYKQLYDIALFRIQRRIGDLAPFDRLPYIFNSPLLINGVSFTIRFVKQLKLNFSEEEINNTITSKIPNQKLNDFTFLHTKGKIETFPEFINIAADYYLKNEMQKILDYTEYYEDKIPKEILMNTVIIDFNNPLKIK